MRFLWSLLLAGMVLASGCLDDNGDDGDDTPPVDDGMDNGMGGGNNTVPENKVHTGTGSSGVSAGVPDASVGTGGTGGEFTVPSGATAILAEIRWDDPVVDLNLALSSPEQEGTAPRMFDHTAEGGAPGSPDSPHSLFVPAPMAGTWMLTAFGNGAAADTQYEWAVTIFHDDVPEGYTAFE